MSTVNEVVSDMKARAEAMRPGPAKTALRNWVERLEEALQQQAPTPTPPRHGTFDNRQTQHREVWVYGERGQTIPAGMCQSKPFGYYPGLD
jgi:hypothetical protein